MSEYAAATLQVVLTGARETAAGLALVGREINAVRKDTMAAASQMELVHKRSWLANQALFTLRRYAYAATLAVTAMGSAAVWMGLKFNASMESNRMAFTQFLGSAKLANQELTYLYNLAKYTPFEFSNVTQAARRFLAFGYSLKETNKYLQIIGDTAAAFGGGGDLIERMVLVFGQIRASGRLLGQDMLQLEQQGIPVLDILRKQLGLTQQQLGRIGAVGIPSYVGIPALMRGMHERFAGMARKQAQTASGQLSTLHDNISQVMGALTLKSFNKASKGLLPGINKMFGDMTNIIQKQGGRITLAQVFGVIEKHYPWVKPFADFTMALIKLGKAFVNVFVKVVFPILKALYPILKLLTYLILGMAAAMNFMANHRVTRWILGIVAVFLLWEAAIWGVTILIARITKMWRILTLGDAILKDGEKFTKFQKILDRVGLRWRYWAGRFGQTAAGMKLARWWQVLTKGSLDPVTGRMMKLTPFEKLLFRIRGAMFNAKNWMKATATAIATSSTRLWKVLTTGGIGTAGKWTKLEKQVLRVRWAFLGLGRSIRSFVFGIGRLFEVFFTGKIGSKFLQNYSKIERMVLRLRIAFIRLGVAITRVGIAAWAFLLDNPVGWIILAVAAVIASLVILYFKWGWFHKQVDKTWHYIKDHWKMLGIVLAGPFWFMLPVIIVVMKYFHYLIGLVRSLVGWLKVAVDWVGKLHPIRWAEHGVSAVTNLFTGGGGGGGSTAGGNGSTVIKTRQQAIAAGLLGAQQAQIHVTIHHTSKLDGQKVAESVSRHRLNAQARK